VIQYRIACQTCSKSLKHGSTAPANVDGCVTSRLMRMRCKDFGCRFQLIAVDVELTEIDKLRLELRNDVPISQCGI
jgi:hypothetical protein